MEPSKSAVDLLVSYLIQLSNSDAPKTDKSIFDKIDSIYKIIRKKFSLEKDEDARNALQRLEEMPKDETRIANFARILDEKANADPLFSQKMSRLVRDALGKRELVVPSVVRDNEAKKSRIIGIKSIDSREKKDSGLVRVSRSSETRNLKMPEQKHDPADSSKQIARYPDLDCPDKVILNLRFSIFIWLLMNPPKPLADAIMIEDTETSDQMPEVELVISAHGFELEGSNTRILKVIRDDDSDERFVLIPRELGEKQIRVDFYQFGRRIGTIRRNLYISTESADADVSQPKDVLPIELKSATIVPPPDLEIYVELDRQNGRTLYFRLHSVKEAVGYNHARFGQVTLQGSPLEKMQFLYREMSLIAREPGADADRRMSAIGNDLWDELIPEDLKREYWLFKNKVKSLLITSDEPWMPWEMIKPYRYGENNEREDDLFWCVQFNMSRWLSGRGAVEVMVKGIAQPVAPSMANLASLEEEVSLIEGLNQLDSSVKGMAPLKERSQVLKFLNEEAFSIMHFASHGGFDARLPDDSTVTLSDGPLRPSDIQTRFGGRRPRPLIFINACEGAQMDFSFTGLGGWADRLINGAHVGAFIGAMWEINDVLALKFAKRFYTALLRDRQPIALAFSLARECIRDDNPSNSTWLAYVLYADPEGRFLD